MIILKKKSEVQMNTPLVNSCSKSQINKITFKNLTFTTSTPDNCCQVGTDVILIKKFDTDAKRNVNVIIPCESSLLGTYKVTSLSPKLEKWPIKNIAAKYFRIPLHEDRTKFAVIPLINV